MSDEESLTWKHYFSSYSGEGREGVKSWRAVIVIINIAVLPSVRGFIYTPRRGGRRQYKSLFDLFLTNFIASEILRYYANCNSYQAYRVTVHFDLNLVKISEIRKS